MNLLTSIRAHIRAEQLYWDWRAGLDWMFTEHNYRYLEQHRATDDGMPERVS